MNNLLMCWAMLLICSDPPNYLVTDHVDLVEVNHFHDAHGKPILNQVIYYDWHGIEKRYQVVDYRLLKNQNQIPTLDRHGRYVSIWHDGNILRQIRADAFTHTWTQTDPEHRERSILSNEERVGLGTIKNRKRR